MYLHEVKMMKVRHHGIESTLTVQGQQGFAPKDGQETGVNVCDYLQITLVSAMM